MMPWLVSEALTCDCNTEVELKCFLMSVPFKVEYDDRRLYKPRGPKNRSFFLNFLEEGRTGKRGGLKGIIQTSKLLNLTLYKCINKHGQ